jgi:tetratricopeptide (TPR) repeat protein
MLWLLVAGTLAAAMDVPVSGDLTPALAQEAEGDSAGALESIQIIIQSWPNEALPRLEAARLRLKLGGDLEQVEADLEVASAVAPNNPRLHFLRGLLWEERGELSRAASAYERAVFLRSAYEDARFRLGGVWATQGDWLKAEMHYRLLVRTRPDWIQVRLQLIHVIEQQGRVADAEKEWKRLRAEQPGNTLVAEQFARFYERTGRPKLAAPLRAELKPAESPKKMRPLRPSRR